eukprot:TRINITY_DN5102_c0_g1_i1.p1 TRINITY_DN5102_c0_g1~~TRINITY_DN5102_c0_g1_i1.p1  ORF type:complete len:169 (+),score=49.75 TRINITY_DN5102_c0_g1_i1:56-508(+)
MNAFRLTVRSTVRAVSTQLRAETSTTGPGAVTPIGVYMQRNKGCGKTLKMMATEYRDLSEEEKDTLKRVAQANRGKINADDKPKRTKKQRGAKRDASEGNEPRKPSKYALYVKEHWAPAYAAAFEKTKDRKEAFRLTTKALSAQYKQLKE